MKKSWMIFLIMAASAVCFAQDQGDAPDAAADAPAPVTDNAAVSPAPGNETPDADTPAPDSTTDTATTTNAAPAPAAPAPDTAAQGTVAVQGINFDYAPGKSRLEIPLSGNASYDSTVLQQDHQVILEIKNAQIPKQFARKLDTSSFKSNVVLVSPYQSGNDVRVVFQLKNDGPVSFTKQGNSLVAVIDNMDSTAPNTSNNVAQANTDQSAAVQSQAPAQAGASQTGASNDQASAQTDATNTQPQLDELINAHDTKKYVGKPITLQLRDADIQDVFRVIAEASEFNIVLGDDVKGKLTLDLVDVPWDQALDIVLTANHLAAERYGSVLRVTTIDAMTKEKEAEIAATRATEAAEPLVVKIFPISYAKPDDMKKILDDFLSKDSTGGAKRGSIQIEPRTNSLVIRDTPSTMEKIKRILHELDTQTPQVLIEAKFVEVDENNAKDVQGRLFSTSREASNGSLAFVPGVGNYGAVFSGSGFTSLDSNFAITPVGGGANFGFSPKLGTIPGLGEIGAFLSILETESKSKIVASPRVVTQNKEKASIKQGQTIMLATTAGVGSQGAFQTVSAELDLDITPQITNDGNITMKLTFSQSTPSSAALFASNGAVDTKSVDTSVLVDSGATLVIGGVYSTTDNVAETGIPILRNLPLIGALFGSKTTQSQKNELFIFLTPRVLNEKEAGIKG